MVNYCQECGEKVEAKFQFCPFCGKKQIKPKICYNCGDKLKDNYQFCPECGTKWDSSDNKSIIKSKKNNNKNNGYQNIEEEKSKQTAEKEKKEKHKHKSRNFPIKFIKGLKKSKKMVLILSLIIIIVVISAAVIILNPFGFGNSSSGTGSFTIDVENNYSESVSFYLSIDGLRYGGSENLYNIESGEILPPLIINEDTLLIKKDAHDITIYIDDPIFVSLTANDITESVSFEIFDDNGQIGIRIKDSS